MDVKAEVIRIDPNQNRIFQSVTPPERSTPDTSSPALSDSRKRPYPCDLCSSKFGSKMELEEHQNSHTGEKPFECNVCKARFNRRSTLWNHKRIHSDTKPFACPICTMRFKWKNSLKCHREMHLRKNEAGEEELDMKKASTYASVTGGSRRQGRQSRKRKSDNTDADAGEIGNLGGDIDETKETPLLQNSYSKALSNQATILHKALTGDYPPSDPVPTRNLGKFPGPQSLLSIAQIYQPLANSVYSRPQALLNVQIINSSQTPPTALLNHASTPMYLSSAQGTSFLNSYRGVPAQTMMESGPLAGAMPPAPHQATPLGTPATPGDYLPNVDFMMQHGVQNPQHTAVISTAGVPPMSLGGMVVDSAVSAPNTIGNGNQVPVTSMQAGEAGYIVKVLPYDEW